MEKREVKYSVSKYYVGRIEKGVTNSLEFSTSRSSNKKQKSMTSNTDVVPHDFMKLLKEIKILPCLRYRKRYVKNEHTEAYLFPVK